MRLSMFTVANGDRPGVPNYAVVITDGVSNINQKRTIEEAERAHRADIRIFAIGINLQNSQELEGIASKPIEENRFTVDDFDMLLELRNDVFPSRCQVLSQSVAPPLSGSEKADIVFALHLSDRANAREVRTVLNYLNSLISGSDVENGRVKIGLLTYNADAEVIFNINQYNSVPLIRNEILRIESRTRSSNVDASAALAVGTQMLNFLYSGRSDAPKALIFVTDSVSTENTELIPFERFRVESEQVNVFSVGIGLNGKEELEDLATAPENVLTVSRYSELPSTIDDLKRKIFAYKTVDACEGNSGGPFVVKVDKLDSSKRRKAVFIQIGIVSWGFKCGIYMPDYYVRLTPEMIKWINDQISEK